MPTAATKTAPPQRRRFTVDEYHQMAEAGILRPNDRVELLDGHIYTMSPIGSKHAACVRRLNRLFFKQAEPHALVSVQNPIQLTPDSEPEPDVALLAPRDDDYASRHPRPDEVFLLVEVSGETLTFDREVKLPLYAQAQIPEVWIVALEEEQIHVYRQPDDAHYADHTICEREDDLTIRTLEDVAPIPGEEILGT